MAEPGTNNFKQDLLDHTDIVELIGQRVSLKKAGQNYTARCPFHDEKTASFTVTPQKQFYYCFGCGAHGNAIDFLINYDRMEFKEALAHLSQLTGIRPPDNPNYQSQHQKRQPLYDLMQQATEFYQQQLQHHDDAKQYLQKRGLTEDIIQQFAIGYAPDDWSALQKAITNNRPQQQLLIRCGMLVEKNPQHAYDRFRHRIMFPIHNMRGDVVAFGGRGLDGGEPKYLNSPETDIFHKSLEIYGLYAAKMHKKLQQLVVVEGYMDVVALHQYGFTQAVATLGTAFNRRHLHKLLRYSQHIVFCFDGDNAGKNAAWKALTTSLPLLRDGIEIRFMFLPDQQDPDSFIREQGTGAFQQQIEQAISLTDFFFQKLQTENPEQSITSKANLAKRAADYLNSMPNGVMRQLMLDKLGDKLHIQHEQMSNLVNASARQSVKKAKPKQHRAKFSDRRLSTLEHAISLLLQQPKLAQTVTDDQHLQNISSLHGKLLNHLLQLLSKQPEITTGQILLSLNDETAKQCVADLNAHQHCIPTSGFEREFSDCLTQIGKQQLKMQLQQLIEKAKQNGLNPQEKRLLQTLLQNKLA